MSEESLKVAPSKTYVALVYNEFSPYVCKFERFALPESCENNTEAAKKYYALKLNDIHTHILVCITLEDFINNITNAIAEEDFYRSVAISLEEVKQICNLLKAYAKQEDSNRSYIMLLVSILKDLDYTKRKLADIKIALNS